MPAYCLSAKGEVLWEKTRQEVPHGQGIWAGNFIDEEPGIESIILRSGHVGDFITVRGSDGKRYIRVDNGMTSGDSSIPLRLNTGSYSNDATSSPSASDTAPIRLPHNRISAALLIAHLPRSISMYHALERWHVMRVCGPCPAA